MCTCYSSPTTDFNQAFLSRKCERLRDNAFTRDFFREKGYLPRCNNIRCSHCRPKILAPRLADIKAKSNLSGIFQYQLSLPYHGLPKLLRDLITENFHLWLKRKYKGWTYFRSEEISESGLLHRHYHAFFLVEIDIALVEQKWLELVNSVSYEKRSHFQGEVKSCQVDWCEYVAKRFYRNPEEFIPADCKQPYRKANNWKTWWQARGFVSVENVEKVKVSETPISILNPPEGQKDVIPRRHAKEPGYAADRRRMAPRGKKKGILARYRHRAQPLRISSPG